MNLAHFNDKIVTFRRDIMKFRISQSLAVVGKLMIGVLWTFRVYPSGKLLSDMGEPARGQVLRWLRVLRFLTRLSSTDLGKTMSSFCTCHMSSQ